MLIFLTYKECQQFNMEKTTHFYKILKHIVYRTSLVAQMVKHLPTMQETWVQSLGREDLEKEMATHSSTRAWKIPWMEEPGRLQSMGSQRVRHDWANSLTDSLSKKKCKWLPDMKISIFQPLLHCSNIFLLNSCFLTLCFAISFHLLRAPLLSMLC